MRCADCESLPVDELCGWCLLSHYEDEAGRELAAMFSALVAEEGGDANAQDQLASDACVGIEDLGKAMVHDLLVGNASQALREALYYALGLRPELRSENQKLRRALGTVAAAEALAQPQVMCDVCKKRAADVEGDLGGFVCLPCKYPDGMMY